MSNLNSNQVNGNSIVLSQFSKFSLKNIEGIKGGTTSGNGGEQSNFIGEYINQ